MVWGPLTTRSASLYSLFSLMRLLRSDMPRNNIAWRRSRCSCALKIPVPSRAASAAVQVEGRSRGAGFHKMDWLEDEPIDNIHERLEPNSWGEKDLIEEAELSRPIQGKVKFVPLHKASSSSAILNGLAAYPDMTETLFEYLNPEDLLQLHHAVESLRKLDKIGRLLPGIRELPYLRRESWTAKIKHLQSSRQRANNTDKPSHEAIKFMSCSGSWHLEKFILCKKTDIEKLTYVKLEDGIMRGRPVKRLDPRVEQSWRIVRLGDEILRKIRLLKRMRTRQKVDYEDERKRLVAE
ncbi:hypothetical protein IWX92DRAFT_227824 [Phyllosticta citricarpa]